MATQPEAEEQRESPVDEKSIEQFVADLTPGLDALVRKFCNQAYSEIMADVQDYLRDNAIFNIGSAFDASERDRLQAYRAHKAVLDSTTLSEAKANARAASLGYWSAEKAAEYRAEQVRA